MTDFEEDICLIETDYDETDAADAPDPNKWQAYELALAELDAASGVCWHPATRQKMPTARKPITEQRLIAIRQEVSSWFVQLDGKFISVANKDTRFGLGEIEKLLPQMLADRFPDDEMVERNASKLA